MKMLMPDGQQNRDSTVLDLGCGPGNSTALLAQIVPEAELTGLDSSHDMIQRAEESGCKARWILADMSTWEGKKNTPYDLVFSNAAFQWVKRQDKLIEKIRNWLKPGGILAVQVPGNGESALHRALMECSRDASWVQWFHGLKDIIVYHEPEYYYNCLSTLGYENINLWETTYWHLLPDHKAILNWYSGTGMRPWLQALPEEKDRKAFSKRMLEHIQAAYRAQNDGTVFLPFRRIFFVCSYPV